MNLKIKFTHINIIIFTIFFFFWTNYSWDFLWSYIDVKKIDYFFNLMNQKIDVKKIDYFFNFMNQKIDETTMSNNQLNEIKEGFINLRPSYLIILLLLPILIQNIKKKPTIIKLFFNNQKKIFLFVLLIIIHYFLSKIFYGEKIYKTELANILYLLFLSIIYCHYRDFIFLNFNKILYLYLTLFVLFSFSMNYKEYNFGQCQSDFFLISFFKEYLNITFINRIYSENSHLGIMMVAVFFSSLFALKDKIKNKNIFILLIILSLIILFNNLSTTFFVAYFTSQIFLILFFYNRINKKFWIATISIFIINLIIFLSDKHCSMKITDFSADDVIAKRLNKTSDDFRNNKNATTLIYERSIIVALETLKNRPFGWGIDGLDDATNDFLNKKIYKSISAPPFKPYSGDILAMQLNLKDGLSNSLKIISEFGLFSIILIYLFFSYVVRLKNFSTYNIFIIILFIAMCIRAAGYFNGGFIFCIFEFLFFQMKNLKHQPKNS